MHPQLEILLQIQDMKAQRRELQGEAGREIQEREFSIDVNDAVQQLDARIEELKQDLPPAIRGRVERFAQTGGRAVVPLINGVCYGCFTAVPTANLTASGRNERVNYCDNCGRFLYVVAE